MKKANLFLVLTAWMSLAGCQLAPKMWQARISTPPGKVRQPASALPEGYKVKSQDYWSLTHWGSEKSDSFVGACRIRKTAKGFEVGSSADPNGATVMKAVKDAADLTRIARLSELTSQGFENGEGSYWSDCLSTNAKQKCVGPVLMASFFEHEGSHDIVTGPEKGNADLFSERTIAVERGAKLWYTSSHTPEMVKIAKCLCSRYSRDEEKNLFGLPASCEEKP